MWLDDDEKGDVKTPLLLVNMAWFSREMNRIARQYENRVMLLAFVVMPILSFIAWLARHSEHSRVVTFSCVIIFLILNSLSLLKSQRSRRLLKAADTPDDWLQQIVDSEVDGHQRQLFLDIIDADQRNSTEELKELLSQAMKVDQLANLSFIQEFNKLFTLKSHPPVS